MPPPTASNTGHGIYLAIYAPKRGVIELWRMVNGPRVLVMRVGAGARLMMTMRGLGDAFGGRCYVLRNHYENDSSDAVPTSCSFEEVTLGRIGLQNVFAYVARASTLSTAWPWYHNPRFQVLCGERQ